MQYVQPSEIVGTAILDHHDVAAQMGSLPKNQPVYVYCRCRNHGGAIRGARKLEHAGFTQVFVVQGGYRALVDAGILAARL